MSSEYWHMVGLLGSKLSIVPRNGALWKTLTIYCVGVNKVLSCNSHMKMFWRLTTFLLLHREFCVTRSTSSDWATNLKKNILPRRRIHLTKTDGKRPSIDWWEASLSSRKSSFRVSLCKNYRISPCTSQSHTKCLPQSKIENALIILTRNENVANTIVY